MSAVEKLLARLVAYPTIAGAPNRELVAFVAETLEGAGATVHELPGGREDARSLHAIVGPPDEPGVLLSAHSDVVGVDGQAWSSDPFALERRDGRWYGRGTADMKGFLAVAVAALAAAARRPLRRPLRLALSADEELGCRGTPFMLDGVERLAARPAFVLVGEPTELRVAVAHKGKAAWSVRVRGRTGHSADPRSAVNAVAFAARLVVALLALGDRLRDDARDAAFAVPHATLGVGPIAGGTAVNVVPDECRLAFEVRLLPGQRLEAVEERVRAVAEEIAAEMRRLDERCGVDVERLSAYPALEARGSETTARRVAALAGEGVRGGLDFGTEGGLLQQRLGVPVVVCGPGSMQQGHRPDEYVAAGELQRAGRMLQRLAGELERTA